MQAYIKAIEPVTVDWSKNICLMIYFAGCDFKCPWCNTPDLLESREEFLMDIKEVNKEIELNSPFTEAVVFTGGEPGLYRQALFEIAKRCKQLKLKVGIETNGSKPEALEGLLEKKLVDFIAIDLKSPLNEDSFERATKSKTFFITSAAILSNIRATIRLLEERDGNIDLEVRTTIVPGLMYKKEDIIEIAEIVDRLNARWTLRRFDNYVDLVERRYNSINPPSMHFLENLRESCLKKFPKLRIEIKKE